ncbi:hypothetical protein BLNAU_20955 [Blattamonas nauphoetae]|uniref:Uncharacterized protein n=1 Tax=Blattamonas nauphoetae TaxID=2049346 RepID=A0ABQ9WX96_9EUKA|nr:hypothetical protein BLNAU_20955 [Blattamonas nauphoetae]
MDVRERRKKSEKEGGEERQKTKRGRRARLLPHISLPVSIASDEADSTSTREHSGMQTDRASTQPTWTLATSSHQSPSFWTDTHDIVAFAQSMRRCRFVTARTAGDSGVAVESTVAAEAVEAETDDERAVEREGGGRC